MDGWFVCFFLSGMYDNRWMSKRDGLGWVFWDIVWLVFGPRFSCAVFCIRVISGVVHGVGHGGIGCIGYPIMSCQLDAWLTGLDGNMATLSS